MSSMQMNLRMLPLDKIRPNPFQPRESFPREEIEELANTIKKVGILQPITVREENGTYRIISGERRWRAAQFAGLTEIPAIVKKVNDSQLIIESLIENLHRADLEPLEKTRAIAQVYKSQGIPFEGRELLRIIDRIRSKLDRSEKNRDASLTEEENTIYNIANTIGLSLRHQARLLEGLRLSSDEQRKAQDLGLTTQEIASISTIEDKETREILMEQATELTDSEVSKTVRIIKKAPFEIKEAILKREIEPDIADEILKVEEPNMRSKALEIAKKGIYTKEGFQTRIEQITRPRIELPTEPLDVQIHNKTVWNLKRLNKLRIYTVGYERKSVEQFIELLQVTSIKTVVDARKNPVSQYKPDFNKDNLERVLSRNGVNYKHIPELGVPTDIRKKLAETGDYEWFFNWYDENVIPYLNDLAPELRNMEPLVFMCTEFDPTKCHRHRIALWYEKKGLKILDL